MDGANYDQLGSGDCAHSFCAYRSPVLHRTFSARSGRSKLLSRDDCVSHALVSPRGWAKAIASLYAAVPVASVLGSLIAGWLLTVQWFGVAGWRWLFIVEGIPSIIVGTATLFYLTDRPAHARWLTEAERNWISQELQAENIAKKKIRSYTPREALF
ncbi:MAG: MFS transporter [Acidobacteriales bacterium]|nr:MFS transporter [Terriglobales bacterium]